MLLGLSSCIEPNVGYPGKTHAIDSIAMDTITKDSLKYPMSIEVEFSAINLNIVLIDSCEYIYGPWGNATVLTHKGNCINKVHHQKRNVYDLD